MDEKLKKSYGLTKDARGNARFVAEMMRQVCDYLFMAEETDGDEQLCQKIMNHAGLKNALETMESDVIGFLNEAIELMEPEKEAEAAGLEQ